MMRSVVSRIRYVLTATIVLVGLTGLVRAQESHWALADDETAKTLINWERLWAESSCNHNGIEKTILADDFQGTWTDGSHYSKQDALAPTERTPEESCVLYEVKVHYFGEAMAVLYGSESAIHTEADGRKHRVKLTWTDTWLKRGGKWQVVAAQDMPSEMM